MTSRLVLYQCYLISLLVIGTNPILAQQGPPNVVIVFCDDMAYADVGCYGNTAVPTPHVDCLAAQGVRLTQFYAAQPVCTASRAALLTGCYPNRIGLHNALMPNAAIGIGHHETTLAELLKERGYRTAIFGKWHLGDAPEFSPLQHGFDEFFGIPYSNDMWPNHPQQGTVFNFGPLPLYENGQIADTLHDQRLLTRQITEHCVDFISRHRDEPFFLYVPHPQPHVPLFASPEFRGKSAAGLYGDVIMEIDWSVGRIMAALDSFGLTENTLFVFASDNGPWLSYGNHAGNAGHLREGKGTVWEGGVRVPCIVRYPVAVPANTESATPLMAIDLLPTIAALTQSHLPEQTIDGLDATDVLLRRDTTPLHEALFFYYNTNELHAVRYLDWKLILPHSYRTMQGQTAGKDGLPGDYRYIAITSSELYNLRTDPSETTNLAAEYPDIVEQIEAMANVMRTKLGDNLLKVNGTENRYPGRVANKKE